MPKHKRRKQHDVLESADKISMTNEFWKNIHNQIDVNFSYVIKKTQNQTCRNQAGNFNSY